MIAAMDILLTSRVTTRSGRVRDKSMMAQKLRLARPDLINRRAFVAPDLGTPTAFLCRMYELANGAGQNIVLFIHGGCSGFRQTLRRYQQVQTAMLGGINAHTIVGVSWPSNCKTYCAMVHNARQTGHMLAAALAPWLRHIHSIAPDQRKCQVHVIVHSMGGQVLEHTLDALDEQGCDNTLDEVVLGAPDISSHALRLDGPLSKLRPLATRVHVYTGWNDFIVGTTGVVPCRYYPSYSRMGRVGVQSQHLDDQIHEVEVPRGMGLHWSFYDYPHVREDWCEVLRGTPAEQIDGRTSKGPKFMLTLAT